MDEGVMVRRIAIHMSQLYQKIPAQFINNRQGTRLSDIQN